MAAFAPAALELYGKALPLEIFGGQVSEIAAADLPSGASPSCPDVIFPPGSVRTRPGLASQFTAISGNPTVNYIRTYTDADLVNHMLALDSAGTLWAENTPGTLSSLGKVAYQSGAYADSDTQFGSEFIAISDGQKGIAIPLQYNGTNLDRVSQDGPGTAPSAQDYLPAAASIAAVSSGSGVSISSITRTGKTQTWVYNGGPPNQRSSYTQVFSWNGVEVTTSAAHGLAVGNTTIIAGVTDTTFNGTFQVATVIDSTHFTYSQSFQSASGTTPTSSGGTSTLQGFAAQRLNGVVTANTSAAHGFYTGWYVLISGLPTTAHGGATGTGSQTGGVVTITTATAHGFVVGQTVVISGASDASFNGTYTVSTVPSPTTFTFSAATLTASATGITASSTYNGIFQIASTPSTTSFTYNQVGQNESTTSGGTATIQGNISAGLHSITVSFITRTGYITKPAPPSSFIASGAKLLQVFSIPIGPSNVVGRQIMITPTIVPPAVAGAGNFFHLTTMAINDNVTTSLILDFSDSTLQSGILDEELFALVTLNHAAGVITYAQRMFYWGIQNSINNLVNLSFDGGWSLGTGTGGSDVPLGWTSDATNGAGGSRDQTNIIWQDAFRITGNGNVQAGMITQSAFKDWLGVVFFNPPNEPQQPYSVGFAAMKGGGAAAGVLTFEIFSPSNGSLAKGTLAVTSLTTSMAYYTVSLGTIPTISPDALLRIYADQTLTNTGFVTIDDIYFYPTNQPVIDALYGTFVDDGESIDGVTSLVEAAPNNGERIASCFKLLDNRLYIVKGTHLYWTQDDGQNEPALWPVVEVSSKVGTLSIQGTEVGEGWAIIASREGAYIFGGGEPYKISQEIQPDWATINQDAAETMYVAIDSVNKRVHIGAPTGSATSPNIEFVLDYRGLNTYEEIASHWSVHYSSYSGKIMTIGDARKWSPWHVTANSAALIERTDGTQHLFRGNGAGNGKIYDQLTTQLSDDGVAINGNYQTYFGPMHQEEQMLQVGSSMKLFAYLSGYILGSGVCTVSAIQPGGSVTNLTSNGIVLSATPNYDFETLVNIQSARLSFQISTNAVGAWFQLAKLVPYFNVSPTMAYRGT